MTKFKRVLSDACCMDILAKIDGFSATSEGEVYVGSGDDVWFQLAEFAERVEQAAIAKYKGKLAEREPVAYIYDDEVFGIDSGAINEYIRKEGQPLYAHPPMLTDHIPDTSKKVFDPDAVITLAERTLSIEITEPLADEIVQFTRKLHEKYTQADHVPDVGKLIVPEGYTLVPVEITIDMCEASGLEGEFKLSPYEQAQNLWSNMIAAAPKYTGE